MKKPAPKGALSLDLSGYPEDTLLDGSDNFEVDGLGTFTPHVDPDHHLSEFIRKELTETIERSLQSYEFSEGCLHFGTALRGI